MDRLGSLSRLVVMAVAATATLAMVAGCIRAEGTDLYGEECERRSVRPVTSDGSLATALAQQAAANRAYRDCMERRGVQWAR